MTRVQTHFAYFRDNDAWKNAIRHSLSTNKLFTKHVRDDEGTRGVYWRLRAEVEHVDVSPTKHASGKHRPHHDSGPLASDRSAKRFLLSPSLICLNYKAKARGSIAASSGCTAGSFAGCVHGGGVARCNGRRRSAHAVRINSLQHSHRRMRGTS